MAVGISSFSNYGQGVNFSSSSFFLTQAQRNIINSPNTFTQSNLSETGSTQNSSSATSSNSAGVSISARLGDISRSTTGASLATLFTLGVAQTNESQLQSIKDTLGNLKSLAEQAQDSSLSSDERSVLNQSFTNIKSDLSDQLQTANFNGTIIFQNKKLETVINEEGKTITFQLQELSLNTLDINNTSLSDTATAESTLTRINKASDTINNKITFVDTQISNVNFHITNTLNNRSSLSSANIEINSLAQARNSTSSLSANILEGSNINSQYNISKTNVFSLLEISSPTVNLKSNETFETYVLRS